MNKPLLYSIQGCCGTLLLLLLLFCFSRQSFSVALVPVPLVDQAGLELPEICLPLLGLKACATTARLWTSFVHQQIGAQRGLCLKGYWLKEFPRKYWLSVMSHCACVCTCDVYSVLCYLEVLVHN